MARLARPALVLSLAGLLLWQGDSTAFRQRDGAAGQHQGLELAVAGRVRSQPLAHWDRVPPRAVHAWGAFRLEAGGNWRASWDDATGVPRQLFGPGLAVPGAVARPGVAAKFARDFLERHRSLLAPGSAAGDFVLAADQLDGGIRSVGFYQYSNGMRVLGGQVGFLFRNDRLFLISSQALPRVTAPAGDVRVRQRDVLTAARRWIQADVATRADARAVEGPYILPLVGAGGVIGYRTVMRATVEATGPVGRWNVYVDAGTGQLVARQQTLMFATGTVEYDVPVRFPEGGRQAFPARSAELEVGGVNIETDDDGLLTWSGDQSADALMRVTGSLINVVNDAGVEVQASLPIQPDSTAIWSLGDDAQADAQLATFIHARVVKDYVRTFAPDLAYLDLQLQATDNIDDSCNAFSDGETINFYRSSDRCENTGRLADVIYHEFGHVVHQQSIIPGVGAFDFAFSEGLSDYLAATIVNDAGMGRGFFYDDLPLRDLDPADYEYRWPEDIGEIHATGRIFGGAMWDLRKALIGLYGQQAGVTLADHLYYAAVQRATDIPSTYLEVLAADDDDGDLTNGTPDECVINQTFGAHGLRAISTEMTPLAAEPVSDNGFDLSVRVLGLSSQRCPDDTVTGARIRWKQRTASGDPYEIPMTASGDAFVGTIPSQPENTVVDYQLEVDLADGSSKGFPANAADPWYEFYVGEVVPLYCTDFDEQDPFANGWSHALVSGDPGPGADDWQWGAPLGGPGSGDPTAAHSGSNVIGNDLGGEGANGSYQPNHVNYVLSPPVDVGQYSDVRVQYRRWLNVEDAHFDKASILVDDHLAWRNLDSDMGDTSASQHQDREWRFHDVPISALMDGKNAQVKFQIDSDGGLELGGWTIDDFCIVASAGSICGDGAITGAEECDDGAANSDTDADACRTNCRLPKCGDGIVDSTEVCDDGNGVGTDLCNNTCQGSGIDAQGGGCGCQSGGNLPPAGGVLLVTLIAAALRRRRRQLM